METYRYPQFDAVVYAAKFKDVKNAEALRSRIVKAASLDGAGAEGEAERDALNFAFVEAKLITSSLHLETAIYQALLSESQGSLRTKTIHSEIIWALNPTNNISEAIKLFGVSSRTTDLILVHAATSNACDVHQKMLNIVEGSLVPMSTIPDSTSWADVKKHYKLNGESALKEVASNGNRERAVIDNIMVSTVAMKSVAA
ncbi:kinase binding protein CGI-121-domain-containing protein [Pisolithus microcarpus]|nr:kinase binding protein CGI-121-domain-containing protein [Pisolithus microcarpus]